MRTILFSLVLSSVCCARPLPEVPSLSPREEGFAVLWASEVPGAPEVKLKPLLEREISSVGFQFRGGPEAEYLLGMPSWGCFFDLESQARAIVKIQEQTQVDWVISALIQQPEGSPGLTLELFSVEFLSGTILLHKTYKLNATQLPAQIEAIVTSFSKELLALGTSL